MKAAYRRIFATAALLILALTSVAGAQTLSVLVVEAASGRPLPGALITLELNGGPILARMLADDIGRASFKLSAPGSFRLAVARIGHSGIKSEPIEVGIGATVDYRAEMPTAPIQLPELVVEARSSKRCGVDSRSTAATAVVWSEIYKALWGIELSEQRPSLLESLTYRKRLSPSGLVLDATTSTWRPADRHPFAAVSPTRLINDGFIVTSDSGQEYHAPDASLLLSDDFSRNYCFNVVTSPTDTTRIGLGFRPAPSVRVPGVEGTLWVDRHDAALRGIEFSFVNAPVPGPSGIVGGRMSFRQVGGEWIVSEWRMMVPLTITIVTRDFRTGIPNRRDSLAGYIERGGEARVSAGETQRAGLTIEGTAFDSISGTPLAGANVSVAGGSMATVAGSEGRFRLEVAAPGAYLLTVEHPILRAYGFGPLVASAQAERNAATHVDVATSSPSSAVAKSCSRSSRWSPDLGVVILDLGPRWADRVEVRWTGAEVSATGPRFVVGEDGVWASVEVDPAGVARICGIPLGAELTVRARSDRRWVSGPAIPPRTGVVTVVVLDRPR